MRFTLAATLMVLAAPALAGDIATTSVQPGQQYKVRLLAGTYILGAQNHHTARFVSTSVDREDPHFEANDYRKWLA